MRTGSAFQGSLSPAGLVSPNRLTNPSDMVTPGGQPRSRRARGWATAAVLVATAGLAASALAQPLPGSLAITRQPDAVPTTPPEAVPQVPPTVPESEAAPAAAPVQTQPAEPAAQPTAQPVAQPEAPAPVALTPAQPEAVPAPVQPEVAAAAITPPNPAPLAAAPQPKEPEIRFNFREAPIDQVLNFFAKESGVPIIYEAAAPAGSLSFISASGYTFEQALSILNLNLQRFGVHLRKQEQYLYLATLQDAMKKPLPVSDPSALGDISPDKFVTVGIPLENARADLVTEQIKTLIGPYGGVVAVPAQNMVIVVESAAQVKRIRDIISAIDAVRPVDSAFRIFSLRFAQAETVHNALKGLLGERVVTTFIDKDGRKTTTQDVSVAGLNLQPDTRTNSIIAVGSASRLQSCEELIALLDVPEAGTAESSMITRSVSVLSPQQAADQLGALFAGLDPKRRPTVIPMADSGKITLVGDRLLLAQASALLDQIDPAGSDAPTAASDRIAVTVALKHVTPALVESIAPRLLTPRQVQAVRFVPTTDGRGIVVAGSSADVAAFQKLITALDIESRSDRDVRIVRLDAATAGATLMRAKALYAQAGKDQTDPVTDSLDEASGSVTLVGSKRSLDAFDAVLLQARQAEAGATQTRRFTLTHASPSALAAKLSRLAKPLLAPSDGSPFTEPAVEPLDDISTLVVRATAAQFGILSELVTQLDTPAAAGREFRVVTLPTGDPAALLARARTLFGQRSGTIPEADAASLQTTIDEASGSLFISGRAAAIRVFSECVEQAIQLSPPARTTRIIDVQNIPAKDLLPRLKAILSASDSIDANRKVPEPGLSAIEQTNSLLVTAEDAQHGVIVQLVSRLDRAEQGDVPPLKLLQLRTAEAPAIAAMLTEQYGKRPQADRASKPVEVRADAGTNTLIVSAHTDLFDEIRTFVEEINKDKKTGPGRVTELFPLKVAKAADVATAMDKLYPEPPTPADRLGRPQPWLKQPKEVTVSAEPTSNSLIIDAPADRMESLRELAAKLDRVELPPAAQLRTWRVLGPSLDAVSKTLAAMATRGVLSEPAQPGKQPVQVMIEVEPKSSTLIVAGDAKTFELTEKVLKDLSLIPIEKGLRIIPVANDQATNVRERAMAIYTAQVAQVPDATPIEVTVNEASNSLMVVADEAGMQRFVKVMDELSRQAGAPREIRLIELKLAKANEVVGFLRDLVGSSDTLKIKGGAAPEFEPIEATNSIMAAAQPGQFAIIEALVRELDNAQTADRPPMRILKLRTTEATNLAGVLQAAFDRRSIDDRGKKPVTIEADPATNTLIISAHADVLPEIEAIVTQLNETQAADAEGREIRIFPLKVARAEELAITIDQMFPEPPVPIDPRTRQPRPDLKPPREVVVKSDRATNSLIVDAPAKRLAGFEQIVKSLDQAKLMEDLELRTYTVAHADLAAVATAIRGLAASGSLSGSAAARPVTVETEPTSRSLVISAPKPAFEQIEKVLAQLDAAPNRPESILRIHALKHARADRIQPLLQKLLVARLQTQRDLGTFVGDPEKLLDISADAASNSVIISAPADVQNLADEVIKALDTEASAAGRSIVRVVPLAYAEAGNVSAALIAALPALSLPSGGTVSIVPAPGSNALILSGVTADLAKVEQLIQPLDVRPSGAETPSVETFALKHSDATTIAALVQSLLVQQQETDPRIVQLQLQLARQNRMDLFKRPMIRVEAAQRTNSLIVSAPLATVELAKSIIERLDVPADVTDRIVATFTPAKAEAASLIGTARSIVDTLVPGARGPVELLLQPASGSIVIMGSQAQVEESLRVLAEFDDRSPSLPGLDVRVVTPQHSDAASLAVSLQNLLSDRSRWPAELRRAEAAGLKVPSPTVTAEAASNRLLLSVPSLLLPLADELVAALDQPSSGSGTEVEVFKLGSGDATSVAAAVSTALAATATPGEPKPSVSSEKASNTVIVTGGPATLRHAGELIKSMDQAVEPGGIGVRTILLKHARAEALAPVLETILTRESLFDKLPEWMRAQALARGNQPESTAVKVAADTRLNAIIVSGPKAVLEVTEQVVAELDAAAAAGGSARPIRIITLQNADATQLATNLEAVFEGDTAELKPSIRVDTSSNSLIVRASTAQMQLVDELASKLDSATLSVNRQLRLVPIDRSRADAALLAETLRKLIDSQGGPGVEVISTEELLRRSLPIEATPTPTPAADPLKEAEPKKSGAADVAAPVFPNVAATWGSKSLPIHQRLIAVPITSSLIASPINSSLIAHPGFPLYSHILFATLGAIGPAQTESQPDAPAVAKPAAQPVLIAVDRASNSLVIVGSPRATERLVQLAKDLEQQMPMEPVKVRIVTLPTSSDAISIADVVRQTVTQIGRASAGNPGGFSGGVSVMPDPAGASLIVLASESDFRVVGNLIASISQSAAGTPLTIKHYPLSNINAARAVASVRDLFSPEPRSAQARRLRQLDVTLAGPDGKPISARIDPASVRLTADATGASIIAAAPADAIPLIDRLIETLDQSPVTDRLSIRRYPLGHARATELSPTLQQLFDSQRQGPSSDDLPEARFFADDRTNSMLVTASDAQHADVTRVLASADVTSDIPGLELAIITLQQASPATVENIVTDVVIGKDPAKKDRIRISAQENSSLVVVRASKEDIAQVREIVARIDSAETTGLPVRSLKLERADAAAVATAVQKFFADRAQVSSRPGQRVASRVAVVGDRKSGTLLIAASDDDFEQVKSLAQTFDTPSPTQGFQFKVIPLKNARTTDIAATIKNVVDEIRWEDAFGNREQGDKNRIYIEPNDRTNSIVVIGEGEAIPVVERVIASLDAPGPAAAAMTVASVAVKNADLEAVRGVVERAMATPGWRSWRGTDPDGVLAEVDRFRRSIILVGKADRVKQASAYITELDGGTTQGQTIEALTLEHAKADRAAQTLRQFFTDRSRAQGLDQPGVTVIGSADGNVLMVSGDAASLATLKDLVAQIDQPDIAKDRRIEVYALRNSTAADTAAVLRSMFQRSKNAEEQVVITPQPSTNALIISAPGAVFDEVQTLLTQLDAAPSADEVSIVPVALSSARAVDVASALRTALPPNIKVTVTPVARSNSLLLTGSKEAIALVMEQISAIDKEPVRSGLVFRKFRIEHAEASDLSFTIEQLLRARPRAQGESDTTVEYSRNDNTLMVNAPTDQIEEIEKMVRELDMPVGVDRTTEFVKLEFANAEQTGAALKVFYGRFAPEAASPAARNVTILPDPLSNSLVIRADKAQWDGIKALLAKLDTEEYDTTRQLEVIPLIHADAVSVARALNEGFRAPLEEQFRQAQARNAQRIGPQNRNQDQRPEATVLIDAEGVPTVSPETQTNSLIVFAGRKELGRVREIVRQLDVSGFADMPTARVIPLGSGKPSAIAATIREIFNNKGERPLGPRAVLIIGDDAAGALIVRADDEKFAQIKTVADTLQQQGEMGRVTPHVVRLKSVAAGRLRQTLLATFTATAQAQGESLAIEVDRASNSLVIACSQRLLDEIKKVIAELDAGPLANANGADAASPLGQSVFIVDVVNNDPAAIINILEGMGITKAQPIDRPGVVSEPVILTQLGTRRAVAVLATPGDGLTIESLIKSLDAAPIDAQQAVAIIPLKQAGAATLAATLRTVLTPQEADGLVGPARALTEHVRRLNLIKPGLDQPQGEVDLAKPIRIIADAGTNSLIVASTPSNLLAIKEIVRTLDALPLGDAVIVRFFALQNGSATRLKAVIDQLFSQGEALRRLPGTTRQGLPPTATGQALAGEIAIAVEERTNTLVVAGREEAVALVEVLLKELDSEKATGWVEPAVIALKHADAATLAATLTRTLVQGLAATPEAVGLQKQYGRLRIAQSPAAILADPSKPNIDADLFAPLTGLVISADEQLNSLLVVGSPNNLAVVRSLVEMLDVEAASAANTVRVFPLKYAAAERVATMARDIFRQRSVANQQRPEDALVITPDSRTNALVVSTSPKSFAILEGLIATLDGEKTNFSVGMHVIPVEGTDVRILAPRIDRLMKERIEAAAQQGSVRSPLDAFSIEAEPVSNLLIVACSEENLVVVQELVKALTAGANSLAASERVEIIQLLRSRSPEVSQSINALYVTKEVARRGENSVSVVSNDRLNALVVSGNEQDMIEIRALASRLDKAEIAASQQIKWIELKSANAIEVVNLIENVIAGRPVGGGRGVAARAATRLQFLREKVKTEILADGQTSPEKAPTEAEIDGAIRDQVTLTPDQRTNSIWITAPDSMVTIISEMIEDIEKSSAGSRKIEYFQLKNSDARAMADLLRDTFNLRQQGNNLVLVPNRVTPPEGALVDPSDPASDFVAGPSLTAVPDERQQLAIAIDARTNTLVVSGTDEYLTLVRDLITRLDGIVANERERVVYNLRNAKAMEIQETLQNYFSGDSQRLSSALSDSQTGSLQRRLEEEVTVIGDENSNKLVISTSPRYMETVVSIVKELDAAPPQVMIQVLLAEVTVDSQDQWGMDVQAGPFFGDSYRFGFGTGSAGVVTSLGVPNFSVSADNFGLLIRALEAQGKLEILSNPQVTVNNNQKAEIQVGDEISLVDGVERSSQGNSFANVRREDVGIILNVVPSISTDGFVRMEIKPKISQLSSRTTQITSDISAPVINKRTVDTVVTVKDGQSIVIGGLIQTTDEERRTKMPILGDIPLIGGAFRSKSMQSVKTELLVILTPRIIPGQSSDTADVVTELRERAVERLEDPSKVQDYLEQIRLDVQRRRGLRSSADPAGLPNDPWSSVPDAVSIDGSQRQPNPVPRDQPEGVPSALPPAYTPRRE